MKDLIQRLRNCVCWNSSVPQRRIRSCLGLFFAMVGTFFVLLVAAHGFGWRGLYDGLSCVAFLGALEVILLPGIVLVVGRKAEYREQIGAVFLIAGTLLVLHFFTLVLSIESLLRQPFVLDPHPYDSNLSATLNGIAPSAVAGLLIGFAFGVRTRWPLACWIGMALIAAACVAFILYGHHFFGLLGDSSADTVWWL